jgi:hypothetical protein
MRSTSASSWLPEMERDGRCFQAYAVKGKGSPGEVRDLVALTTNEALARGRIRDAIASGYDYGYLKQDGATVAYLTEQAFAVRRR